MDSTIYITQRSTLFKPKSNNYLLTQNIQVFFSKKKSPKKKGASVPNLKLSTDAPFLSHTLVSIFSSSLTLFLTQLNATLFSLFFKLVNNNNKYKLLLLELPSSTYVPPSVSSQSSTYFIN